MPPVRLFIAIPLPADVRESLAVAVAALREQPSPAVPPSGFKWVRPENYHVTLKFLGEVPADRLSAVEAACRAAAESLGPASMSVASLALHPASGTTRLIVGQMQGDTEAVQLLAHRLEDGMHTIGFPREGRPFWPHVTIARARTPLRMNAAQRSRWSTDAAAHFATSPTFAVNATELIESRLLPAGPIYTAVGTFPLGEATGEAGLRAMI